MPVFVHLTDRRDAALLRRNGIRMSRARGERPAGVYCMPLLPDLQVSLQWTRELMRGGRHRRTLVQLRFRLDDEETVWVGRFSGPHAPMPAAQAVAWFLGSARPEHEVILPRRVAAAEIASMAAAPPLIGWRYWPGANGGTPSMWKSRYGARRLRERERRRERKLYLQQLLAARAAGDAAQEAQLQEWLLWHDDPGAFDDEGLILPGRESDLARY